MGAPNPCTAQRAAVFFALLAACTARHPQGERTDETPAEWSSAGNGTDVSGGAVAAGSPLAGAAGTDLHLDALPPPTGDAGGMTADAAARAGEGGAASAPSNDNGVWPTRGWARRSPEELALDGEKLAAARDFAQRFGGAGLITRHGYLVMSWGNPDERRDLKSTTKSFGTTALGIAVKDGKLALSDKARDHHPGLGTPPDSNADQGWVGAITIKHLATHTAGFAKGGGYEPLLFAPGTAWEYSDGGPNWLAECITLAYRRDVRDLMFERVFAPLGIDGDDLAWRNNAYRPHTITVPGGVQVPRREFGSGISANVDAMAKLGYLYLRNGRWEGQQILTPTFVAQAGTTPADVKGLPVAKGRVSFERASHHYGMLWWNNNDGELPDVPRSAFWSWGLHESLIAIFPEQDMVIARHGNAFAVSAKGPYDHLAPLFTPIAAAVER